MRVDKGLCGMPLSLGAGYVAASFPLKNIQTWTFNARTKCFCHWRHKLGVRTNNGEEMSAWLKRGTDPDSFQAMLRKVMAVSRGRELDPRVRGYEGGECGSLPWLKTSLQIGPAGDVAVTNTESSIIVIDSKTEAGFLQDLRYIRYQHAPLLGRLCCGHENKIEVALRSSGAPDKVLSVPLRTVWLEDAHDAMMKAFQGSLNKDAPPIKEFKAGKSKAVIRPGLLTLTTKPKKWKALCNPEITTTVQAKDVSYMVASLVPWQSYLFATFRAIKCAPCCKLLFLIPTIDLCKFACDLNPCPLLTDLWRLIFLVITGIIKFVVGILTCCCVVCRRKTEVFVGGAGPTGKLRYRPTDNPEQVMKEMAAALELASRAALGKGSDVPLLDNHTIIAISPSLPSATPAVGRGKEVEGAGTEAVLVDVAVASSAAEKLPEASAAGDATVEAVAAAVSAEAAVPVPAADAAAMRMAPALALSGDPALSLRRGARASSDALFCGCCTFGRQVSCACFHKERHSDGARFFLFLLLLPTTITTDDDGDASSGRLSPGFGLALSARQGSPFALTALPILEGD